MKRYELDPKQDEYGEWVLFEDAQEDIYHLISIIKSAKIKGSKESYDVFDKIIKDWDLEEEDFEEYLF